MLHLTTLLSQDSSAVFSNETESDFVDVKLLNGFLRILNFSPSHCLDSILVACLRKVQEWSFVSILGELRMHSGCRQFDVEQFIEYFDPDIIDISRNTPDFLKIHRRLKVGK